MIKIDRDKAEGIVKDAIREYRNPLLSDLDIQYLRALEKGEDTSTIVLEKQRLRDLPDITEDMDIEELRECLRSYKE